MKGAQDNLRTFFFVTHTFSPQNLEDYKIMPTFARVIRKTWMIRALVVLMMCQWVLDADAVRAQIAWKTYIQPDGTVLTLTLYGDEHFNCYKDRFGQAYSMDSLGVFHRLSPAQLRASRIRSRSALPLTYPHTDWNPNRIYRQLVVLLSFDDCDFLMEDPLTTYQSVFNEKGYNQSLGPGSVADYFRDQSNGLFNIQFDVYGPFKVNRKAQASGNGTNYGGGAFREATQQLISDHLDLDYSLYDWDSDGDVDQVIYIYAGQSGNQTGIKGYIWPSTSSFKSVSTPDGHNISKFSASGELWSKNISCGIGTVCHEFSHCLGLPDIYPTYDVEDVISIVDEWDLMDGGNYTNYGWCPPNYSALEKMLMGWLTPKELNGDTIITGMQCVADGGDVYLIPHRDDEFYLLENRQWRGWDAGLPGHGLVVFHVKYDQYRWRANIVNTIEGEPYYCLVGADNLDYNYWYDLFMSLGKNPYVNAKWMNSAILSTAPYPWNTDATTIANQELSATSVPAALMYEENADGSKMLSMSITEITEHEDGTISFKLQTNSQSGISILQSIHESDDTPIYSLQGIRTAVPVKGGIYIRDGRKFVVK